MSGLRWFGDRAKVSVLRELARLMTEAGKAWLEDARRECPVQTGKLRDSLGFAYANGIHQLILFSDIDYAVFVNLGSVGRAANPFMIRALSAIPRVFRGSAVVSFPNVPEQHQEKAKKFAIRKDRRIRIGHGKFK